MLAATSVVTSCMESAVVTAVVEWSGVELGVLVRKAGRGQQPMAGSPGRAPVPVGISFLLDYSRCTTTTSMYYFYYLSKHHYPYFVFPFVHYCPPYPAGIR